MTFASAERAYLTPPEDYSCSWCEDDADADHGDCIEAAADAYEDAMIQRAEFARECAYEDEVDRRERQAP
jgi:hypothetical protein